ncbi:hypothetical protein MKX34_14145 [Paenibacillus sp. FSL R5-0636]
MIKIVHVAAHMDTAERGDFVAANRGRMLNRIRAQSPGALT